jgi:signal transduction histidine kinase
MQEVDKETNVEIQAALKTINKRSTGLMNFVESYRSLTKIPEPNFSVVGMSELVGHVETLMKKDMERKNITLTTSVEPDTIEVQVDEEMIEQVLINLLKNSMQALKGRLGASIQIKGFYNKRGRPTIQVIDNGQGILDDVIDKIFIPFFTTKQSGSGIGLSLSKQIMRLHGGTITAQSVPNKETIFNMTF